MKILALDTSTRFLCVGVYRDQQPAGEYRMDLGRKHSAFLLPALQRILDCLRLKLKDFDYFAVGVGPGSFTGIRIGVSVIKGFAFSLNKPLLGISSLDILACRAQDAPYLNSGCAGKKINICPVIDAKRGLVFSSLYRLGAAGLKREMAYKLISIADLLSKVPAGSVFLGDGLSIYKREIAARIKNAVFLDEEYWYPRPGGIIALARRRINAKLLDTPDSLRPIYLYPKECQIKNTKAAGG